MGKDHDLWSEKFKDHLNDLNLLQNFDPFFVWGSDLSSCQDPSNDLDLCHDFSQKIRSKIKDHFKNVPTSGTPNSVPPNLKYNADFWKWCGHQCCMLKNRHRTWAACRVAGLSSGKHTDKQTGRGRWPFKLVLALNQFEWPTKPACLFVCMFSTG